tara:strand:- start:34 stop:204 length:171 start_codon:yes stop_codon:yes gene_type:complete
MANTWDETGKLRDSIAERQMQRQRDSERERREHQFNQSAQEYWNKEHSKQQKNRNK